MILDAVWVGGWPRSFNTPPGNLYTGAAGPVGISRYVTIRHGRATNVSFVDGHAETLPLQDLWQIQWSQDWVTPPVSIPGL